MDIRKLAVEETAFVHLHDASDELLYEPAADGTPDQTKAVGVTVYGESEDTSWEGATAGELLRRVALPHFKKGPSW